MPLQTTGIIKFSDIAAEFEDTHPIRIVRYYKDKNWVLNRRVITSHISTFPKTWDPFRLSLFYGTAKFGPTDLESTLDVWPENIQDYRWGLAVSSQYEWLNSIIITNTRQIKHHADERLELRDVDTGKTSTGLKEGFYDGMSQRIHAHIGDTLQVEGHLRHINLAPSHASHPQERRIVAFYAGGDSITRDKLLTGLTLEQDWWVTPAIGESDWQNTDGPYLTDDNGITYCEETHNFNIVIDSNFVNGIYILAFLAQQEQSYGGYYGSVKKYTLEIWTAVS